MRLLIQRVQRAQVEVEGKSVGAIDQGALVFFGVTHGDTLDHANWLVSKLIHLRMFPDADQKMNLSLLDVKGSALIVSQFTLYADCTAGRRPSFVPAAPPALAESLYHYFVFELKKHLPVATGVFGASMQVSLLNDGPATFLIDSK